jgi:hypothetical protein
MATSSPKSLPSNISLDVFKEAKEFKEGALDKLYPGKFTVADIYDLFKDQVEHNRKVDETKKQRRQAKAQQS